MFPILVAVLSVIVAVAADYFIEASLRRTGPSEGLSPEEIRRRCRRTRLGVAALTLPVLAVVAVTMVLQPGQA